MTELLLGCGPHRDKRIIAPGQSPAWTNLVTLDSNPAHAPDHQVDLEQLPLPFPDNAFSEIHAYEVLEHTGAQGDWRFFFAQWNEFWRILAPGGYFCATVPRWDSIWAWGDPGHKRVISEGTLVFLAQSEYAKQVGKTSMTDYRQVYRADFKIISTQRLTDSLGFILEAVKPSRYDSSSTQPTQEIPNSDTLTQDDLLTVLKLHSPL